MLTQPIYATLAELKEILHPEGVTTVVQDDRALRNLETISRAIERMWEGRAFYPRTATRYYTAEHAGLVFVDDLLAVTTLNRWSGIPEVPTMAESLPGYEVNSWYGLLAPAGTPREIVQRLNAEVAKGLKAPDARQRLFSIGAEPLAQTPEVFAAFIQSEVDKWAKVVKTAGIKIE